MTPGQQLGHYEILEKIGEGGMGAVWKARDTRLGRLVAVKALSPNMISGEGRKRLMLEARAASNLQHPNIVTLHDIGSQDGIDYLVMEYVAGETLDQRLQRTGPLPPDELLRVGMALASALSHAHNHGLVHRDLKPSNVILAEDGTPKLLDFGLAKRMWSDDAPTQTDETMTQQEALTQEGAIVGTISYMSPEQAQGRPLDARTDIFSFGAVLYEMASGRRAFQGPTKLSTLTAILRDEPEPLTEVAKDTPAYLSRSVVRCLRKLPEERYPNAAELERDLASPAPPPAASALAPPIGERPRWILPAIAVAAAVLLGLAATAVWLGKPAAAPPSAGGAIQAAKTVTITPFTTLPGIESFPRWSPDGNRLAFHARGFLHSKDVATGETVRLAEVGEGSGSAAWAPDGKRIAAVRGGQLILVQAAGGVERIAAGIAAEGRAGLAWSPDGSTLVFSQSSGADTSNLVALSMSDYSKRPLTATRAAYSEVSPAFSPDGSQIAYVSRYSNLGATVRVMPASGGEASRQVGPEFSQLIGVDWSADGRSLCFTGTRQSASGVWLVAADGNPNSSVERIADGRFYQVSVARQGSLRIASPQASSDRNQLEADIVLIEQR